MYLKNLRDRTVDHKTFFLRLEGLSLTALHLRVYYTRCLPTDDPDLLFNYPENLIKGLISYVLVRGVSLQFHNIHSDGNNYIFDIQCTANDPILRDLLTYLFSHDSLSFCSHLDIEVEVLEPPYTLQCQLYSYRQLFYPSPLFSLDVLSEQYQPLELTSNVSLQLLDEYYAFLEQHYEAFYQDVQGRACTCWCFRDQMAELLVKRHSDITNGLIMFPSSFEEAKTLLQMERIIQIVPNTIPEQASFPIELVIDIDIPPNFPYKRVREITVAFIRWLSENNLRYYRRLTGSYQCGQHIIIPVKWDQAYLLTGKPSVWEVYSQRKTVHLLSDSLRSTAELVTLAFLKEKPQYAKYITTRIFDAHSRYKRLLFDISTITFHRGRRALLSMHPSHRGICVSLNNKKLPAKAKGFYQYIAFEQLKNNPSIDLLSEEPRTNYMTYHNTTILKDLINHYERFYLQYLTTLPARFEESFFNIPIPQITQLNQQTEVEEEKENGN